MRYVDADRQTRVKEHNARLNEVEMLEQAIEERFFQEKQARKEMEARLLDQVEEKFMAVRKALSLESRNRYENIE